MRLRPDMRRFRRSALGQPRDRRITPEAVWYIFITLACGLVLAAGLISAAAVSPVFCSACHRGAARALADTAHAGTTCDSCHMSAGTLGLVEQRMRVVSMVLGSPVSLITGSGPAVPSTDNARCLECHEPMVNKTVTVRGVTMNHRAPQKERWLCVQCHRGVAHPSGEYQGSSYTMEMCLACHNANPQNPTTCGVCHPPDESPQVAHTTPWSITHGANWRSTHGMGDLATCKSCHSPGYCVACHNMDLPHPANYLAQHGTDVLSRASREADCLVCHKGTACDNCHGIEMPHPDAFVAKHVDMVKEKGTAVCERCHSSKACDSCHNSHLHPGVPEWLLEELKKRPVRQP